jgi:hypothetical protein
MEAVKFLAKYSPSFQIHHQEQTTINVIETKIFKPAGDEIILGSMEDQRKKRNSNVQTTDQSSEL